MSTTIDERVVEMRFDNDQFKQAAGESLNILEKLGKCIDKSTTGDNIGKIAKSIDGINFGSAVSGVESLTQRFSALGIVGKRVLENITDGIMGKLSGAIHNITGSIISGGINRAMNIENARFQLQGVIDDTKALEAGFKDAGEMVAAVMKQAGDSVDGTAYSYDVAAKAASMFAASGVKAGTEMEQSLKAIAGVSATFNANYEDISNIFTTVAGQGKVMTDQLNQLSFRGMNAAASLAQFFNQVKEDPSIASEEVAKAVQSISKGTETTEADIREMVTKGKINFAMFSEAMAVTFGDHAKDANKTFQGSMANIRAALARTGEMFVAPLITEEGSFVRLFNSIRKKVNEFNAELKPLAKQITTFINSTVKYASRVIDNIHVNTITHALVMGLQGVGNVLKGLYSYISPIGQAFSEAFGGITYKNILDTGRAIMKLTENFKASKEEQANIKDAFKGVFDVVKLVAEVFVRLLHAIVPTLGPVQDLGHNFTEFIGNVGRGLSTFTEWVRQSEAFEKTFEVISTVVSKAKEGISGFVDGIKSFVGGLGMSFPALDGFTLSFDGFLKILESIKGTGIAVLQKLGSMLSPLVDGLKNLAAEIWKVLSTTNPLEAFVAFLNGKMLLSIGNSIGKLTNTLTTTLLNTVLASLSNFLLQMSSLFAAFKNFDRTIDLIKATAESLLMLAAACFILSTIPTDDLAKSVVAIQMLTGVLVGAFMVLNKFTNTKMLNYNHMEKTFTMWHSVSTELLKLAASILVLGIAVKMLSSLSWDELIKGMGAVTLLLIEMVAAAKIMQGSGADKSISKIGGALLAMAIGVLLLTQAVKQLGGLDIETLAKGLISVGILMVEMAAFTRLVKGGNMGEAALSILVVVGALKLLVGVVRQLGEMRTDQLAQGIIAIGVALAAMTISLNSMQNKGVMDKAFAAIELAVAMLIVAKSLQGLAQLKPEGLLNAVLAMCTVLFAMVLTLNNIQTKGAVENAFAILEVAAALFIIAKALEPLAACNPANLLIAVLAMGLVLAAMTGALAIMSFAGDPGKMIASGFAAIEMAAALFIVAKALEPLAACNPAGLLVAVVAMAAVLVAMTAALSVLSFVGPTALLGGLAAIELAAAMWIVAQALMPLTSVPIENLTAAVVAMGAMLLAMTLSLVALSLVGPLALAGGLAAIEMAAAMWIVAQALVPLTSVDTNGLDAAVKALCDMLLAMTLSLMGISLFGPLAIAGGLGAIEMAAAMWIIAQSLMPLTSVDAEGLNNAVSALGSALLAMTLSLMAVSAIAPLAIAGGLAAIEMAASMLIIATSLKMLSTVPADQLMASVQGLGAALLVLSGCATLMGLLSPAIIAGSAALMVAAVSLSATMLILAPALNNMAYTLNGLANVDADTLSAKLPVIATSIAALGLALKAFGPLALAGATSLVVVAEGLQRLVPPMLIFSSMDPQALATSFIEVAKGIAEFGLSLKAFGVLSGIGAESLNTVATAVMKLAPALMMLSNVPGDSISAVMESLSVGFKSFGQAMDEFGLLSGVGANALNTLADGIQKLAPALLILSSVPGEELAQVMGALGGGFRVFGEALEKTPFFGTGGRADALNTLCDGVKKLGEALPAITELNVDSVTLALGAIGAAFKDFGTALGSTPILFGEGRAESIGVLCDQITRLADGMKYFIENMGYTTAFQSSLTAIGEGFQSFGTALRNAPIFNSQDRAAGIGGLCDSIMDLASGISYFMNMNLDAEAFGTALNQIGQAFATFGTTLQATPMFNTSDRASGISILVGNIERLADGLNYFINNSPGEGFGEALDTIKTAFLTFSQTLSTTPWFKVGDRAEGLGSVIDNLDKLTDAVSRFQNETDAGACGVLHSMGAAMADFGGALKDTPFWNAEGRANAMQTVLDGLNGLADAAATIASIEGRSPEKVMGALGGGLRVMGEAMTDYWYNVSQDSVNVFNNVIAALQNLAGIDSDSLVKVNDGIRNMFTWLNSLITFDTEKISAFSESLKTLATDGIAAFQAAFSETAGNAGDSTITTFINQLCSSIKGKTTMFMTPGNLCGKAFLAGINATATADGPTAAVEIVNAVCNAIMALETLFNTQGVNSATAYIKGIEDQTSRAAAAGTKLGNSVLDALKKIADEFKNVGIACAQGFANGLANNEALAAVARNAAALGAKAVQAAKDATKVQSPSKEFRYIGEMCGTGMANGLKAMTEVVSEASADLGKGSIKSLNDAIKSIYSLANEYMNFDPTIRPNVDLDRIRQAADETTRLFNQAIGKTTLNAEVASAGITSQRRTSSNDEEIQNGTTNAGGNTYNFIQNNRSPKALSRIEIYRDTKSLFKQYREAVEGV